MKIKKVQFKNFRSYGNDITSIDFDKNNSLNLLVGKNGHGKCLAGDTEIEIEIEDEEIAQDFFKFIKC